MEYRIAPPNGSFLGSASALFHDQTLSDLYLSDAWNTVGVLGRIAISTLHWGIYVVFTQSAFCLQAGQPGPFLPDPALLHTLQINYGGVQPPAPFQLPHLHHMPILPFMINGVVIHGYTASWHTTFTLRLVNNQDIYYHPHARRRNHRPNPPPILPANPEKPPLIAEEVTFGTQVQAWRKGRCDRRRQQAAQQHIAQQQAVQQQEEENDIEDIDMEGSSAEE